MIRLSGVGVIRQMICASVTSEGLRQAFLTILFAGVLAAAVYGLWTIPD